MKGVDTASGYVVTEDPGSPSGVRVEYPDGSYSWRVPGENENGGALLDPAVCLCFCLD